MSNINSHPGRNSISGARLAALLLTLVAASLAIHGYHYGIEDEAIYLPAIKAHLNPALYPHDAIFFKPQTRPTLFDDLVAASAWLLHAPVDWTVFACYLGTLLAFYAALWALTMRLFPSLRARLGAMLLVAVLLTLPVAGTRIFIVDQHLHPRTLATALILFAAAFLVPRAWGASVATREYLFAAILMTAATLIHIQMAFYGWLFLGALLLPLPLPTLGAKLTLMAGFAPLFASTMLARLMEIGGPAWQEASRTRSQHYLLRWEWYEWLGAIAPIFLLWGLARIARRRKLPAASAVAMRTAWFAAAGLAAGCVMTIPPQLERLTAYQPMRILHLTYLVIILLGGGLLAEFVLKQKLWRWALLLLPIAAGLSFTQFASFPNTHHIEWPGRSTGNDWVEAFNWVKANTPVDAYFVLDPHYMSSDGEDFHGFRGLAERGQLADWSKDPGVALLFPELATRWSHEVHALDSWASFTASDFHRLHAQFGVDWTVLANHSPQGAHGVSASSIEEPVAAIQLSDCPYRSHRVVVCRVK